MEWKKSLVLFSASCSISSAAYDLEPLTYNHELWSSPPTVTAKNFPELGWKMGKNTGISTQKGLTFWGKDVQQLSLTKGANNTTSEIRLTLLAGSKASNTSAEDFTYTTHQWKQLFDKNLNMVGKRMPSIKSGEDTTSVIAWNLDNSVVVLRSKRGEQPKFLTLSIYERSSGVAAIKKGIYEAKTSPKKKQTQPERGTAPKPTSGPSVMSKNLENKTSYLAGSRFRKKNISGSPEYYLVYFSASW